MIDPSTGFGIESKLDTIKEDQLHVNYLYAKDTGASYKMYKGYLLHIKQQAINTRSFK